MTSISPKVDFMNYSFAKLVVAWLLDEHAISTVNGHHIEMPMPSVL